MAAWVGPLITAGASLLGKLLGGDDEQKTTSEIDYVKLRENAERGGFNPLTALRAGGGAGFTTTHHPALSSGQFIAEAIGGLGNAIAQIDPMRDATAKLEHDIKQATLANIQADTAWTKQRASLGGVPVSTGARAVKAVSPLASNAALASQAPTTEVPTRTNPWPSWMSIEVNPWMPDMAAWEDSYGDNEIFSTIGSVVKTGHDAVWNALRFGNGVYQNGKLVRKSLDSRSGLTGVNIYGDRVPTR